MNISGRLIYSVLLTMFIINSVQADDWREAKQMPLALQEIYTDIYEGMIYIGGGIPVDDAKFTNQFSRYNSKKNKWEILTPMPERRHHVTISATEDHIFAIGGFIGGFPDWQAQDSVYVYSPRDNSWENGVSLSSPRGEHVSAVVGGKIYVIGGRTRSTPNAQHYKTHHDTKFNEVFDPQTSKWTQAAPAPTARNSAASVVIDGKIYVVGGRQNQTNKNGDVRIVNVPNLEVYDPVTDSWESRAAMPIAQGGLAAAVADGKLYVFGGEQWYPEEIVSANSWVYDPETNRWEALPNMPTPRHGLAAAALGSNIHVFGGSAVNGLGAVDAHEVFKIQ